MKLFRYCGNKERLVKYYKSPPLGTLRIVEPFAGSMCYAFSYPNYNKLGIEVNERIVNIYNWLKSDGPNKDNTLEKFNAYCNNFDIRKCSEFSDVEKDYIRLSSGSLMTGNLDKNIIYKKEKPLEQCIANSYKALELNGNFEVKCGSCFELYKNTDVLEGDLVFMDPPYESSDGRYGINYSQTKQIKEYIESLRKTGVPIIFTYGNDAKEVYPEYNWELVTTQKVVKSDKNAHKRVRNEYVVYFNFEDEEFIFDLFENI